LEHLINWSEGLINNNKTPERAQKKQRVQTDSNTFYFDENQMKLFDISFQWHFAANKKIDETKWFVIIIILLSLIEILLFQIQ
jgi:hypothetical protein